MSTMTIIAWVLVAWIVLRGCKREWDQMKEERRQAAEQAERRS
jgi:hypothetical protein